MDATSILTNKIGPLPAWAWGGIAGGGLLGWRVWSGRKTAALEDPVATGGDAASYYDTASLLPASGSPVSAEQGGTFDSATFTPPDWVTTPPSWFYELPGLLLNQPPIELVLPQGALGPTGGGQEAPDPAPAAPPPGNMTKRVIGPWGSKGARDNAVKGVPPAQVRRFSSGAGKAVKFYAEIYTPAGGTPAPSPSPVTSPSPHAAPLAANPTMKTAGPWASAAARDRAVAGIPPSRVRKHSAGGKFYADVWS